MSATFPWPQELEKDTVRWQWRAAGAGVLLLVVAIIGGIFNPDMFFRSYLFGFLFCLGLPLGSMALLMTQYMTGGAWGVMSRRVFEAASRTLPLLAILFIPILFGIPHLYPWAHPDLVSADGPMRHRAHYMTTPMFTLRAVLYFALWFGMVFLLNRWSAEEDERGPMQTWFERLSAPGLIVYVFSITFAAVDWAESLFPDWYSTMWGFLFVVAQGSTAICFAIAVLCILWQFEPMRSLFRESHLHDLGKLVLMFVMLFGYFAFSQLLIVWEGNLATEIPWYLPRWHGSWSKVGVALIVFEFFVPFFLLLSKSLKKSAVALSSVITLMLFMRMVDMFWIVMPDFYRNGLKLHWLEFVLPLAMLGMWGGWFLWELRKRPLLPLHAVNLEEALNHAG